MSDLRAAVEALPTPKRYENDANGNWFTTDMEYGWDTGVAAVLALIDAHQCYDVDELAEALRAWSFPEHAARPDLYPIGPDSGWMKQAAAIIARLHEAKGTK